jgi:hypothetical protein
MQLPDKYKENFDVSSESPSLVTPDEINILEVTIARKVLPHPQGIKGSMHNLLNKGLFI